MKTAMQELIDDLQQSFQGQWGVNLSSEKFAPYLKKEKQQIIDARIDGLLIDDKLDGMHWYDRELLKVYILAFKGNAKKLSRETKIPYMSVWKRLNRIKQTGKFELFDHEHYFNQTYKNK
jgi:hypothetical protein